MTGDSVTFDHEPSMWFGTIDSMRWVPTPQIGATMTPVGSVYQNALLGGGMSAGGSFGSHKTYSFEWPQSSTRRAGQTLIDYASGVHGRGLIHFQDPLTLDTNVLPAAVASPGITAGMEGASLCYGIEASAISSIPGAVGLPTVGARYQLGGYHSGLTLGSGEVYVPIPEGHTLYLGAFYSSTGSAGVFATPRTLSGSLGAAQKLTELSNAATNVTPNEFSGVAGVYLWAGKSSSGAGTLDWRGTIGRILNPVDSTSGSRLSEVREGPWIGGQGNSGCRFSDFPEYTAYTGIDGGQVGFSASLVEVGLWAHG